MATTKKPSGGKSTADTVKDTIEEHVIDPAKKAGAAMRASGAKIAQGGAGVSTKLIDQAEANAKDAFAAMRAAAKAKDMTEVLKIQGDYIREQGARAMAQAREIGELITQFGRDAVEPFKPKD